MNPLQERLRLFVASLGISMQVFERQCDIKAGTVSRMTDKSYYTTFHKIQESYPQLNMEWLKTGEGEMLNSAPNIDIDFSVRGDGNAVLGDVNHYNDPKTQIAILKERIRALEIQVSEKSARIDALVSALTQAQKIIDLLAKDK